MLSQEYLSNMFYDCIPGGRVDMFHVAEEHVISGIGGCVDMFHVAEEHVLTNMFYDCIF